MSLSERVIAGESRCSERIHHLRKPLAYPASYLHRNKIPLGSRIVVRLFELRIEAAPLSRCVAFPSQFVLPPSALLGAFVHIALHLDPLLLCIVFLLLFVIVQ